MYEDMRLDVGKCVKWAVNKWMNKPAGRESEKGQGKLLQLVEFVKCTFFWTEIYLKKWCFMLELNSQSQLENSAATATAKSLQSCLTVCDPTDGSPSGSPIPGILHQEHWSGLSFPPPMHESEKWKGSRSVMSDPQRPQGLQPSRLLCPQDFPGRSTGVGSHCLF